MTVMPILDSQVHAYECNHPGRRWIGTLYGPPEVTGDQMVAAMDAVGIDGHATGRAPSRIPTTPATPPSRSLRLTRARQIRTSLHTHLRRESSEELPWTRREQRRVSSIKVCRSADQKSEDSAGYSDS
jgi:hypothetical protein